MRRRGNIWVWLIGMPIILWAIAHWGFYYFIKTKLDQEILQAAPYAVIKYQNLSTSLSGKIDVEGITVEPVDIGHGIDVAGVYILGPDALSYLMDRIPGLGSGEAAPARLRFVAKQIKMDISGDKAQQLDKMVMADNPQLGKERDLCRVGGGSSFAQLQELGFDNILGDMKASYHFQAASRKLYVEFSVDVKDIQRTELSLTLDNVSSLNSQNALTVLLERMKLSLDYIPEFGRKMVDYCAQKRGVEPEQFKLLMVDDFFSELRSQGIIPGVGLSGALREFLSNWGNLTINIRPAQPLNMLSLMAISKSGEKMLDKLGMQLLVNGRLITDMSFYIRKNTSLISSNNASTEEKKAPPKPKYVWEYRKVSVANLSGYLDHRVIVVERGGRTHQGLLVDVGGGRVSIQKRVSGGKFTAHLQQSGIVSAKVEVRVKVPVKESTSK